MILRASPPRFTRHQKQRNFPYNYFFGGGVWGGADKKWKGKFFVLVSPLRPPKSSVSISIILESFPLRFSPSSRRARRALVPNTRSISRVRSHFANTSHWPLTFVRDSCSVLLRVRSVTSFEFVVFKVVCAGAQSCPYVLVPPSQYAHKRNSLSNYQFQSFD